MSLRSCLLLLLFSLAGTPLLGYVAGTAPGFVIEVSVSGPEEINVFATPWKNAAYQGEGKANIDITATYTPPEGETFNGQVLFSLADGEGHATFTKESGWGYSTASATVDLDAFNARYVMLYISGVAYANGLSGPTCGFYTTIFLYKNRILTLPPGDENGRIWTTGRSPVTVNLHQIKLTPASNYYACTEELLPVSGETISPSAPSFNADPPSATTDENGAATFTFIPTNNDPYALTAEVAPLDLTSGSSSGAAPERATVGPEAAPSSAFGPFSPTSARGGEGRSKETAFPADPTEEAGISHRASLSPRERGEGGRRPGEGRDTSRNPIDLSPRSSGWFTDYCTPTPMPSETVTFTAGSGQSVPRTVIVPYARISAVSGDVQVKGALAGEWQIAQSGCNLGYGDMIKLGPMDAQTYEIPSVSIEFFNLTYGTIDGRYTKTASNLLIKLGDHIETQEYTFLTDVRNLAYSVSADPREWAKSAVTYGLGKGVEWGLGAYGWVAAKVGGQVVTYGIKKMDDWATAPPLRIDNPTSDSSTPAPPMLDSKTANEIGVAEQSGSTVYTTYRADGTADITNRGDPKILSDGTTSVILPPWSVASVDLQTASAPSQAAPLVISPFAERPALTITPGEGSTVTTLQPKFTFDYSGSMPVLPSTFTARLNGYLVSPFMRAGTTQTTWMPPMERPLVRGSNLMTASVTTIGGATSRGFVHITASGALPAPAAPRAYPGRTTIVLQWNAVRDALIAGYKVYRSATAEGAPVLISSGVLKQDAFVDGFPLAGPNYYRISGVTGIAEETPLSAPRLCSLSPTAPQTAPPAVTDLTATPGEGKVTLRFAEASRLAVAFRIERQAGGSGPFTNVLPNDGVVSGTTFVDTAVNWTSYVYRVTSLGNDLTAGTPADSSPVVPQDGTPGAPEGLTADVDLAVAVEWNPSPESDLAGFHVERIVPSGSWVRLTASPVTQASYYDTMPPAGLYGYRVIAVDNTGHESAPSKIVSAYVRGTSSITAPTGLRASAVSASQVEVYWNIVPGASSYTVQRKGPGTEWELLAWPNNHWLTDATAASGTAYLYRVQADGDSGSSGFTAPELATTVVFDDSPLAAGTAIKALHFTQLRSAITAVRQLANSGAFPYTETPYAGGPMRAIHLTEMRTALTQALNALTLSKPAHTDTSPAGLPIKAVHIQELRDRLQ